METDADSPLFDNARASVRSAARVLTLVDWLATQAGPASLADAAAALNLPKSSIRLLLITLVEGGYAVRDSVGNYRMQRLPGDFPDDPAWSSLIRIASPVVQSLVNLLQESGFIAVLVNNRIRYLTKTLPEGREVVYNRNVSLERIPHQVASGLAILSTYSDAELAQYLSTCDDPSLDQKKAVTLRGVLAKARRDRVISNTRGVFDGAAGAAAPVLDLHGKAIAALNISGPIERVKANLPAIEEAVADAAQRVAQSLAHRRRFNTGGSSTT